MDASDASAPWLGILSYSLWIPFHPDRTAHLPEQGGCRPKLGQQALYHNAGTGVAEPAPSRRSQAPCAVAEH